MCIDNAQYNHKKDFCECYVYTITTSDTFLIDPCTEGPNAC